MFGPGGVFWLLHHELRLTWRGFSSATRARGVGLMVFYAILAAFVLIGGYFVARALSSFTPSAAPMVLGGIGMAFAVLFSFMLSQALMLITESIYQRGDLDFLLASPLPPWRILIVRMAAIAINVALLYLLLLGAVFVFLPLFGGWAWMMFLPTVLGLALLAVAVGLLLARLMFRVFGPKLTRIIAQILAGLIGAGFFLALQSQNFVPPEQRGQAYIVLMERIAPVFADPASALSLPGRAALGVGAAFPLWIVASFGAYVLSVWWFARRFVANAAAISALGSRGRRDTAKVHGMRGGVLSTLVRKEWRLLLRDPLLLSQIMLQLLYFLPLFFVFWNRIGEDFATRFVLGGFASAFVLLSTSLAASLTWLTVSAEDAPDLIAASPVPRDEIDNAKALAAGSPVLALLFLPALAASIWIAPLAGAWMFAGGAAAIASTCLIGVWYQKPGSRKNFRRRRPGSFLVGLGQSFVIMGWTAATALAVIGWALVAIIPALIAFGTLLALHESRPRAAPAAA